MRGCGKERRRGNVKRTKRKLNGYENRAIRKQGEGTREKMKGNKKERRMRR